MSWRPRRHIREERAESLRHRRVRESSVAEPRIWQVGYHCRLPRRQNLTGLGTDHDEAENAVVALTHKRLHEPLSFVDRLRPQHGAHGQPRIPRGGALASRFDFAHSHTRERRVREHAVWNQPIARAARRSGQIVANDAKIVLGYVRELWAAGAFPDGPDLGRTRVQPLIDANIAAIVQRDTGLLKPDPGGVRNAPRRDQDVAALDRLLARGRAHSNADFLSRPALPEQGLGRQ